MRYYRKKPDLQALYEQKEHEKIERQFEMDDCWKLVKQATSNLGELLVKPEKDIDQIHDAAKQAMDWFNNKVNERNFKHLSRFDI